MYQIAFVVLCLFGEEIVLNTESHNEFKFMPSGAMRHRMTWTVEDGAMLESDLVRILTEFRRMEEQAQKHIKAEVFIVESPPKRDGTSTRYQWTAYCDNCNAYWWMAEKELDFHFRSDGDGFTLDIRTSFFDSVDSTGKRVTDVFIMPGVVQSATGHEKTSGRVASMSMTSDDWKEKGTKFGKTKVVPRIIHCGPSLVSENEIAEFQKEYDAAKDQRRNQKTK